MKNIAIISIMLSLVLSCSKDGTLGSTTSTGAGTGGSLARFTIVGDHLLAADNRNLKVFDISNRENAIYLSNHQLNLEVETLFARDSATLFVGTTSGMLIYDISSAPQIRLLSQYDHIVSCDPVVADQEFAYVTLHSDNSFWRCNRNINQLDIVDIRNLEDPELVNEFPMIQPKGLGIYGDTLLVCDKGVKVFDVSDRENLKLLKAIEGIDAIDIIPNGDLMIIATSTGINQYRYSQAQLTFLSAL